MRYTNGNERAYTHTEPCHLYPTAPMAILTASVTIILPIVTLHLHAQDENTGQEATEVLSPLTAILPSRKTATTPSPLP